MKKLAGALIITALSFPAIANAKNTITVKGHVVEDVTYGLFRNKCSVDAKQDTKVRIQRWNNSPFYYEVTTDENGYYEEDIENNGGNGLFAVYLPDEVTTDQVYKNVRPCAGNGRSCTKRVNLHWHKPALCPPEYFNH